MMVTFKKIIIVSSMFMMLIISESSQGQQITQIDTTGFDSLLTILYKKNPELKIKNENIIQEKENVYQNKVSILRNFRLGLQFNTTDSWGTSSPDNQFIAPKFGINIQVDFESFFSTASRVRQAKSRKRAAEQEYLQSKINLEFELYSRFTTFKKAVRYYQIQLERSRSVADLMAIAKKRFANGEITLDQYSGAIENNAEAQENLLDAELDLLITRASLMEMLKD